MSALAFQAITALANGLMLLFIGYYLISLRKKEAELKKKETKIDTQYHEIVDNALAKERKILADASAEADEIIAGGKYISTSTKESVEQALKQLVADTNKETVETTDLLMDKYGAALRQIATGSLSDFQSLSKTLQAELQKEVAHIHETLLPNMQKELENYKQLRMQEAEALTKRVVQTASQEILNKTISLEDHQKLVLESLEKAKKEGIFN